MSAFMVGADHIDAMLSFATLRGGLHVHHDDDVILLTVQCATEVGRVLLAENERSVNHRYNENESTAGTYEFRPWYGLSALQVVKACNCFDYQACETGDYYGTRAAAIVDAIRAKAIRALPGYDECTWQLVRGHAPAAVQGG